MKWKCQDWEWSYEIMKKYWDNYRRFMERKKCEERSVFNHSYLPVEDSQNQLSWERWLLAYLLHHIIYGKLFTTAVSLKPETCKAVKTAMDASFWQGTSCKMTLWTLDRLHSRVHEIKRNNQEGRDFSIERSIIIQQWSATALGGRSPRPRCTWRGVEEDGDPSADVR